MSTSPETRRDFLSVVGDLGLLSPDVAEGLAQEAAERGVPPSQLALQKGLLDAVQVDIVETLLHPDEVVPDYEILDVIGTGGMGVVFRARQKNLDRIVALKTVLVSHMAAPGALSRFEQEARAVAKLRHPNVVAAYDFGRHEGRLYFAMELVEGEDLEDYIQRYGRLDEATAWGLARQAAAGLAHAHQHGIVHRDIKPANLLLVNPPEGFPLPPGLPMVKIADFGLAFLTADAETRTRLTAVNKTVGSPHYLAPELLSGAVADQRADIYSLGATVYHMLLGDAPYAGQSLTQILAQKVTGKGASLAARVPGVSADSATLVAEMMAQEVDLRLGDYAELMRRIDALSASGALAGGTNDLALGETAAMDRPPKPSQAETAATRPVSTTVEVARPQRRRRWLWIVTALAVVGVVAAAVALLPERVGPPPNRDMVPTGWGEYLFRGTSANGWLPRGGSWADENHLEHGRVISGANGLFTRSLPRSPDGTPPVFFRLRASVCLHEAEAAELHFGIAAAPEANGPRYVVRVTHDGVAIGRRTSDEDAFEPLSEKLALSIPKEQLHAIFVERQYDHWWVSFLQGRKKHELATLPVRDEPLVPQIRLLAEGGAEAPALFADIYLEALMPPK